MPYTAEHLDLITNVKDQFTSPLTRLSTLLETVGQQADQLDPIFVRVVVQDRQLRKLQRRMAGVQAMNVTNVTGGAGTDSGLLDPSVFGEKNHTLADVSETMGQNFRSLEETIQDTFDVDNTATRPFPPSGSSATATAMGAMGAMAASGGATTDGGGGGGPDILGANRIRDVENAFGIDLSPEMANTDASILDLIDGDGALTGVTGGELDNLVSSRAIMRSLDFDELTEAIFGTANPMGAGALTPRDIAGFSTGELAEAAGLDDVDAFFERFTKRRRLQWERLKGSISNIRVGMTQFWDIFAAALPLIFVFVGALPAAIGGLAALGTAAVGAAAALGSIAGLGLFGAAIAEAGGEMPGMEDLQSVFEGVGEDFFEAFRGPAERLAPLFEDGLDGLERLFDELARRAQLLPMLSDDARAFGNFLIEFLGGTFEELIRFGEAARPIFSMIAGGIEDINVIRGMAGLLAAVLPQLRMLTIIIVNAVPDIMAFSDAMLETAVGITRVISTALNFITAIISLGGLLGDGNRILGKVVGTLLTFSSVLFLTTKLLGGAKLLTKAWAVALGMKNSALATNLVLRSQLLGALAAWIGEQLVAIGVMNSFTAATYAAAGALATLLSLTGIGALIAIFGGLAGVMADEWARTDSNIQNATDSLKEFQRQEQNLAGRGGRNFGNLDQTVYVDVNDETNVNVDGNVDDPYQTGETASFIDSSTTTDTFE
jgi:hypothetical protein